MACTYQGIRGYEQGTLVEASGKLQTSPSQFAIVSTDVHTGSYCLNIADDAPSYVIYDVSGTPDNVAIGIWFRMPSNTSPQNVDGWRVRIKLSTGEYLSVRYLGASGPHLFAAYVDGVKVADGTTYINALTWYNLQIYVYVDNSGSFQVKLDGAMEINYSGDTLPTGASAEVDEFDIYMNQGVGLRIDDVSWGTGDWTGDVRVDYLTPIADTAVDDWTASAGDSYACVDETPASDADYIYTDTNADDTELDCSDFDGTNKTPVFVTAWAQAKETSADADSLEVGVDSNGTDDTTQHVVSATYAYYSHGMINNPDDAAAWEDADLDLLKARVQAVIA